MTGLGSNAHLVGYRLLYVSERLEKREREARAPGS